MKKVIVSFLTMFIIGVVPNGPAHAERRCNDVFPPGLCLKDNPSDTAPGNPRPTTPPVTNPPVTNPPVTNPPGTNPPGTAPPVTSPPPPGGTNPPPAGGGTTPPPNTGGPTPDPGTAPPNGTTPPGGDGTTIPVFSISMAELLEAGRFADDCEAVPDKPYAWTVDWPVLFAPPTTAEQDVAAFDENIRDFNSNLRINAMAATCAPRFMTREEFIKVHGEAHVGDYDLHIEQLGFPVTNWESITSDVPTYGIVLTDIQWLTLVTFVSERWKDAVVNMPELTAEGIANGEIEILPGPIEEQ